MTNTELALVAFLTFAVLLTCYYVYRQRKKGKSWSEIGGDLLEDLELDFGGIFRRRRSRPDRDNDDDGDSGGGDFDGD